MRSASVSIERVAERILDSLLAAGERPTLRSVAALMATSPRTLQRRLDARGVTFSELVARAEAKRACMLLRDGALRIRDVGAALGYRDPSSFSRAFRHWTGVSPREYRRSFDRPARGSHLPT